MKKIQTRFGKISSLALAASFGLAAFTHLPAGAQEMRPVPSTPKASTYVIEGSTASPALVAGGSGKASISNDLYSVVCPAKNKCTVQGLYMSPQQASRAKTNLKDKTILIDVRTLEEINYVGNAKGVDSYVPYVNLDGFQSVDTQKKALKVVDNSQFLESIQKSVESKGLQKQDPIILICRSGDRSARAVDLLSKAGYTQVYTVSEGFEGDLDASGTRRLNGWKNAGLDWGYNFDESKVVK